MQLTIRVRPRLAALAAVLPVAFIASTARTALAAAPLTVAQAIATEMLYVELTTQWRTGWDRSRTRPSSGPRSSSRTLTASFSHAGQKSPMAITGGTPDPDPTTTTAPPTSTTSSPTDSHDANTIGKSGSALRSSLHAIIKTQTVLTHDQVWDALEDTDPDPNNTNNLIEPATRSSLVARPRATWPGRKQVINDTWQHNRNPFVDHPEWISSIWPWGCRLGVP